ncbi:MAG: hypothetical protein ACI9KE_001433 [Polyangiales bacterium]|jgi:hypothetical protein
MVQQSAAFYERCQAAELNPVRTLDERRECWVAWLEHYTPGQPLERVSYAQERRIALAHGEEIAPLPDREDPGHELRSSQEPSQSGPTRGETDVAVGSTQEASETLEASAENPQAIADPNVFRQDEGAPPGRHFSARAVAPPDEAPIPGPPGASNGACGIACNPRWYECAERCNGRSGGCINACISHHRQCMGGCNGSAY